MGLLLFPTTHYGWYFLFVDKNVQYLSNLSYVNLFLNHSCVFPCRSMLFNVIPCHSVSFPVSSDLKCNWNFPGCPMPHMVLRYKMSLTSKPWQKSHYAPISVFIQICPRHCERNSVHIVRRFPSTFRFVLDIVAHNVDGKSKNLQYVGVQIFFKFWPFL